MSQMVNLDDPTVHESLDRDGMFAHLQALPGQLRDAWALSQQTAFPPDYGEVDAVVVAGMGGSAIGADLVRSLVVDRLGVPLVVWRNYGLPGFVGPRTLVVASSHSGTTEETLSALKEALTRGAKVLGISTGGDILDLVRMGGGCAIRYGYRSQPRAALGYPFGLLLGALVQIGLVADLSAAVAEAADLLDQLAGEYAPATGETHNPAKELARALHGRIVVAYGAGPFAEAARRWKGQVNENAKGWAFWEELPELNHNAVAGYAFPAEIGQHLAVVLLRASSEPARLQARQRATAALLAQWGVPLHLVDARGASTLAQLLSVVLLSDYTSAYLALLNQVDPTPIPAIDFLKAELARSRP
ncbi:MAG: bifunctional phosphoglucose/phosphomannose isomerase [Chloroflexi bacterium]|nr:bifunctional phosphoglucose/phosphomannose isomerase [Chloroflexota bacterium]